ncbi:MFS transporter [Arcicella rigui]|uniref:MFS transporter n=1 Tax=Arcicella rigui TaxID=797020 RepID=A0ABU5QBA6_9BACT|nr:MFS transporter [Arcicella rigui]MEA5139888.1 MFS transporter [Arcicella rigui]
MNPSIDFKNKYYPWIICFSGLLILVVINGLTTTSLSVFDKAFINEFHWQRDELKLRESITNSVTLFFILLSGIIIDKVRVKKMILFGALVLSIALLGYSFVSNKYQAYFIHFLLGLSMISAGSVACIILVSSWFREKKGLALGIVLIGTSLGSAIFSPLNNYLLNQYGWRQSFLILSAFPIFIFIYTLLVVENSPSDINSVPLGEEHQQLAQENSLLAEGMTYSEATKTHLFWLICLCGFLTFYCLVGTIANVFLYLVGLGFSDTKASSFLGMYFIIAGSAKLLVSLSSDFINPYWVFSICCIMMIAGFLGLSSMESIFIFPSIAFMAVSWGGIYTLYNLIAIKSFGLASAGKINGTINMFEGGGALLGPFLTGLVFTINHSYQLAFSMNAGLMVVVLLLSFRFKSYMLKLQSQKIHQ